MKQGDKKKKFNKRCKLFNNGRKQEGRKNSSINQLVTNASDQNNNQKRKLTNKKHFEPKQSKMKITKVFQNRISSIFLFSKKTNITKPKKKQAIFLMSIHNHSSEEFLPLLFMRPHSFFFLSCDHKQH